MPKLVKFVPFDPAKKTSEATATDAKGVEERIIKGAYTAVAALTAPSPAAAGIVDELEKQGFRVLALAAGPAASVQIIGMIALSDPPRSESRSLISELHTLGVATVMVTGDAPATAAIVAHIGRITIAGVILGGCFLAFSTAILAVGKYELHLEIEALRTLTVVGIVFGSQVIMRDAEIKTLTWGQIDFTKNYLGVGRSKTEAGEGQTVESPQKSSHGLQNEKKRTNKKQAAAKSENALETKNSEGDCSETLANSQHFDVGTHKSLYSLAFLRISREWRRGVNH